jgi:hypothetical protein
MSSLDEAEKTCNKPVIPGFKTINSAAGKEKCNF